MNAAILSFLGAVILASLATALKTWRDVALIRADHIPSREIIARLTRIETELMLVTHVLKYCPNCAQAFHDFGDEKK